MGNDALMQAMSDKDLAELQTKYPNNESIQAMIKGELEIRSKAKETEKVRVAFADKVAKLAKLPAPPDDVHNIYIAWKQVETPQAVPEGASEAKRKELEANPIKSWAWVVEVNKGFTAGKGNSDKPTASKRAVTLNKRNGNTLEFVGNFLSASKACEYLKINVGGDSATRVLNRDGYILDPYDGTDYTK